jgi:hypothetical protein
MGALADRIGPHVTLLAGAGLTVLALALIVAWCPELWSLRLDPALPPPGGEAASQPGDEAVGRPSVKPSGAELPQQG